VRHWEFIRLHEATTIRMPNDTTYVINQEAAGFGFYPKTNEYKVINIWKKYARRVMCEYACEIEHVVIVEIHTLGTPTWRDIEVDPQISSSYLMYPTCVNGVLHWIRFEERGGSILCFCFERERFQSFPSTSFVFEKHNTEVRGARRRISLGELKGCLYICDSNCFSYVTMWVMNEYGIGESWTQVYHIDTLTNPSPRCHALCCR
jgi:F-box interacting protein